MASHSQHRSGLHQAGEDGLVQEFVPEPRVKVLNEPVLLALDRRDAMSFLVALIPTAQVGAGAGHGFAAKIFALAPIEPAREAIDHAQTVGIQPDRLHRDPRQPQDTRAVTALVGCVCGSQLRQRGGQIVCSGADAQAEQPRAAIARPRAAIALVDCPAARAVSRSCFAASCA